MRQPPKTIHPFIAKHYRTAIVGASANPAKYGYIIFNDLRLAGFTIIPVNPKGGTLEGKKVLPTLRAIAPPADVAIVVVPPAIGLMILDDAKAAGVKKLWFQPGAESQAIRDKAKSLGLDVQADGACVMVERRTLGLY